MARETKVRNAYCFRVQYLQWITFYTVFSAFEAANGLDCGRLKVFGNKHVSEIFLSIQVVDRQPLYIGDFLVVRKFQSKVLVEVPFEDVGAEKAN